MSGTADLLGQMFVIHLQGNQDIVLMCHLPVGSSLTCFYF